MFTELHFASSVPSLGGAALCMLIPHFRVPALLLLLYVIRAGSGWGLYVCARRSAFSLSWAALHMHTTTLASSAPSPCRAALHVHSSTPLTPQGAALQWIPQSFASSALSSGGAALRVHVTVSYYLCSPWREQSSMCVPQHFASSTLSYGGAAPCEHIVAPLCLHTFSGEISPAGGTTVFTQLCTLSRWESPVCTYSKRNVLSSTPLQPLDQSPGGGTPCMHTMAPSCFCCIQIQVGWLGIDYNILQVDQKTWMECLPTIHV